MKNQLLIILFLISSVILPNEIKESCEKILDDYFGSAIHYEFSVYKIESSLKDSIERKCGQKFFKDEVVVWKIFNNDSVSSFAILDNVYGKSLPITFLVLFDKNGNIIKSDIIKYREAYGGGVANSKWLDQFSGKNNDSQYELGNEIQSISGATISSRSVTKGINKLSLLIQDVLKNNEYKTVSTE